MEIINNSEIGDMPTKASVARGRQMLKRALDSGALSPSDIAYIKVATDPWHDTSIEHFTGVPDEFVGKSVTEVLTVTADIKSPFAAGTGNFNVRVSTLPILGNVGIQATSGFGSNFVQAANSVATTTKAASLEIAYSTGTPSFSDYPNNAFHFTLPAEILEGNVKVAGCGLEIFNTTAPLNKQGTVSVARVPQPYSNSHLAINLSSRDAAQSAGSGPVAGLVNNAPITVDCVPIVSMPTTLTELTTYPDYNQWEAAEGLYSVIRQNAPSSASPLGSLGVIRLINNDLVGTESPVLSTLNLDTCTLSSVSGATLSPNALAGLNYLNSPQRVIQWPSDSICAMFTGLSETSTLTVKLKFYIERRVNTSITALRPLVPFVKDSPSFNPIATEIVSRLLAELPCAVMFKENPAGEWWDRVLGAIGDIAPIVLGLIPHPVAQIAAKTLPVVVNAARQSKAKKPKARRADDWTAAGGGGIRDPGPYKPNRAPVKQSASQKASAPRALTQSTASVPRSSKKR